MFRLHYHCQNGGDGSANVQFHENKERAKKADESQSEGWGESSASSVELKVEDGKIFFKSLEWNDEKKKYDWVWKPVEQVKS